MAPRPGSTLPDLSPLRIDDRARNSGGGRRWLRWFAAALGAVVLVAALVIVLQRQAPVVEVAVARTTGANDRVALLNASGYVTPRRRATVAAKITARVTRMNAEEGMRVQQGQVLALLDDSDARVRLNSAIADRDATSAALADLEVNLANADRELGRTQSLKTGGVTSQQALDLARTAADSYRARIVLAREQIRAADARIKVAEVPPGPPVLQTLVAEIYGPDDAGRREVARQVKQLFSRTEGVVDVDWYVESPRELPDRERDFDAVTMVELIEHLDAVGFDTVLVETEVGRLEVAVAIVGIRRGSVAMLATQGALTVGELVLLSCPVHPEYAPNFANVSRTVSVRVKWDLVILADGGGQRFEDPGIEEHVLPIWFNHSATHSPDVWATHHVDQMI